MKRIPQWRIAGAWVFVLSVAALNSMVRAQDQAITFSATGDVPYSSSQVVEFQEQLVNHNLYSPSTFFVHVGDIFQGGACDDPGYALMANVLKGLAVPVFIIPGDNETIDCSSPAQGLDNWKKYFLNFEQNFCGAPAVEHQNTRPENFVFTMSGVLFIGINMVGGSSPYQSDAEWVSQQLQAKGSPVRAAVVFSHAGPDKSAKFSTPFRAAAAAFGKPVLFLHGHGHSWLMDNPFPETNILRVQVDNGGAEDPVEIMVTAAATMNPDSMFILKRNPWSSEIVYNMPPCVNAGSDQTVSVSSSATLQGQATDDGDPNPPGALTVAWSQVSGPGAVTFENANALSTTASFSAAGTYVLRLTANDGELQNSDELTIVVNGSIVHEESRTGGSSGSTTVMTSVNLTAVSGDLYLAAISSRPRKLVQSVTGLGLNWTLVKSICSGNNSTTGMDVWMAQGIPQGGSNGAVNAAFASAPSTAVIAVSRYSGVAATNPIGNVIAGNTNGLNGACSGGVDGNSYSFNLATTASNALVYGAVAIKARTHTPGADYSERVEFQYPHAVNPIGVAIEDESVTSASTVSVDGSFNGPVDWALVALEIRPQISEASPIVHEESQTGGASSSMMVTTSTNLTAVSGDLYLAAISLRPKKLVQSVAGLGLNWTLVESICSGNNNTTGMDVWMAQGIPQGGSNGVVTATFWSAPSTAVIAVSRYSGVAATNPIGNVIAGNTNGLNGACSGGIDGNAYSFDLTTTANNAVVYGAVALKARTHTPGAGYIERMELQYPHAVNPIGAAIEDKSVALASNVTVSGSFNGPVDWALVALEIKPAGSEPVQHTLTVNTVGSGSVALNPPGGTYNVGTEVTLTATPDAGFQFSGWSGDLTGSTNPATLSMDSHKNVTATFTAIPWSGPIVYEESQTGGSSGSVIVTTSANLTGVSGNLYLTAISSRPRKLVQSVSGLGLTWTLVKSICSGNNSTTNMDVWMAQGTPSGNGAVTATFASAPSTAVIAVSRYSGVAATNPIGNIIAGNTNGLDGACSGGVDGNSYSFNLATTANDAVVYGAVALKARTHTPSAGYTERVEFQYPHAVNPIGVAIEDKNVASTSTVTVSGSFNGPVDLALVAIELKPQSSASKRSELLATAASAIPSAFQLEQNYPNPFSQIPRFAGNPSTVINFSLPFSGKVNVNIYDATGQLVHTLVDEEREAGQHAVRWDGRNRSGAAVAAGIYLYRIVVRGENDRAVFDQTRRMIFLK
jgi:Divergent InlB B-repeat domain/FlgD Ig-like domain/K319L-like, PKD domain/Calcineurin-like phosphoesterase